MDGEWDKGKVGGTVRRGWRGNWDWNIKLRKRLFKKKIGLGVSLFENG